MIAAHTKLKPSYPRDVSPFTACQIPRRRKGRSFQNKPINQSISLSHQYDQIGFADSGSPRDLASLTFFSRSFLEKKK